MAKRKKNNSLERKLLKHFRNNPDKEYNYKQLAAFFEIKDTKKRNDREQVEISARHNHRFIFAIKSAGIVTFMCMCQLFY